MAWIEGKLASRYLHSYVLIRLTELAGEDFGKTGCSSGQPSSVNGLKCRSSEQ